MTPDRMKRNRTLLAAVASTLALGLAGCGDKPADGQFGQNAPSPSRDRGADATAQRGMEQPGARSGGDRTAQAGKAIDDAALTAKVKSALIAEPNLKSLTINVETMAGVVTLKGTADSQNNKQKAEQVASAIDGVRNVKNELVVIAG
jgi:hyperosmotically inducible protein